MEERKGDRETDLNLVDSYNAADMMTGMSTQSLFHLKLTLNPPNPKIMAEKMNSQNIRVLKKPGLRQTELQRKRVRGESKKAVTSHLMAEPTS